MKRIDIVSLGQLNRALARVHGELDGHGFWTEELHGIDVYLVPVGWNAYGWQYYRGSGDINIPAVSMVGLKDWWRGSYVSLSDVLRHEYAHAIAHCNRGLMRSRRFTEVFEAPHDSDIEFEHDPALHVTAYAATSPCEDFAETLMLYLRHEGRLPARFRTKAIGAKWRFIRELGRRIKVGARRWE